MQHIESDTTFWQTDWLSEIHISSCWFLCASVIKAAFLLLPLRRTHTLFRFLRVSFSHVQTHSHRRGEGGGEREREPPNDFWPSVNTTSVSAADAASSLDSKTLRSSIKRTLPVLFLWANLPRRPSGARTSTRLANKKVWELKNFLFESLSTDPVRDLTEIKEKNTYNPI